MQQIRCDMGHSEGRAAQGRNVDGDCSVLKSFFKPHPSMGVPPREAIKQCCELLFEAFGHTPVNPQPGKVEGVKHYSPHSKQLKAVLHVGPEQWAGLRHMLDTLARLCCPL